MDPRAYRIAQEFLRAHLREAKYKPEFLQWAGARQFRNPETDNKVQFISLPVPEQRRIYQQWAQAKGVQEEPTQRKPESREEIQQRNLDIARNGEVIESEVLSKGGHVGRGEGGHVGLGEEEAGVNESYIVKLRHNGQEQAFIRKPAEGEEAHLRIGIPGGTYHAREQAAYQLDQLLGGHGVVPATVTRGSDDGSYQLWVDGARAMHGKDLDELASKVKPEELSRSPDFERMNVLDLITGHEDRHRGNLLFYFEDDKEDPEHLRFVAIDNGLSLAEPSDLPDHRAYYHPFAAMYVEPTLEDASDEEVQDPDLLRRKQMQLAEEAEKKGEKAVAKTLADLSPEMQAQLKQVDLGQAAKALTSSGVAERGAVRAALVRIASLQKDPKLFGDLLKQHRGNLEQAWQAFQHQSGWKDELLSRAGAQDREKEITEAVEAAKPKEGWTPPDRLDNQFARSQKEMDGFDSWGIFEADEPSRDERSELKTKEVVGNVRDRWLSSVLRRTATRSGRLSPKRP